MTDPVRVGLIGCGNIGGFHSRNLRNLMRDNTLPLRVTATCDHDAERAASFARLVGAARHGTDALALIASNDVDAVYICTETSEHPALLDAALAAGKHVFCEKPLAVDLATAERMHAAVMAAGVVNQVGLVLNHAPVFGVIEHLMRSEDLGQLLTAHLRDDQFLPIRGHYDSTWRGDVAKAGGGTLIEHSIHDVDLFRRLFGEVTAVRCSTRYVAQLPGIEDIALVRFEHAGGAHTTLSSVWHDIDERPSTRRFEAFFERGFIHTDDDYFGSVTLQGKTGPARVFGPEEVNALFCEVNGLAADQHDLRALGGLGDRRFVAAIRSGERAHPDFATALASHRIVDACYRSARSGSDERV